MKACTRPSHSSPAGAQLECRRFHACLSEAQTFFFTHSEKCGSKSWRRPLLWRVFILRIADACRTCRCQTAFLHRRHLADALLIRLKRTTHHSLFVHQHPQTCPAGTIHRPMSTYAKLRPHGPPDLKSPNDLFGNAAEHETTRFGSKTHRSERYAVSSSSSLSSSVTAEMYRLSFRMERDNRQIAATQHLAKSAMLAHKMSQ